MSNNNNKFLLTSERIVFESVVCALHPRRLIRKKTDYAGY